jgi:hypothetical protein
VPKQQSRLNIPMLFAADVIWGLRMILPVPDGDPTRLRRNRRIGCGKWSAGHSLPGRSRLGAREQSRSAGANGSIIAARNQSGHIGACRA